MKAVIVQSDETFKRLRKRKGLAQVDVALLAGVSESIVAKIESGRVVSAEARIAVMDALDAYEGGKAA